MYLREEKRHRSPSANRFPSHDRQYQGPNRNTYMQNSNLTYDALGAYRHRTSPTANSHYGPSTSYQNNDERYYAERGDRRGVSPTNRSDFAGNNWRTPDRREWQTGEKRRHEFEDHHRFPSKIQRRHDDTFYSNQLHRSSHYNRHEVDNQDSFSQKEGDHRTNSHQQRRDYVSGRPSTTIPTNENEVATAPIPLMSLNIQAFQARGTSSRTHSTDDDNCSNDSGSNSKTSSSQSDSQLEKTEYVRKRKPEDSSMKADTSPSKAAVTTSHPNHTTSKKISGNRETLEEPTEKPVAEKSGDLQFFNSSAAQIRQYKIPKRNAVENESSGKNKIPANNKVKDKITTVAETPGDQFLSSSAAQIRQYKIPKQNAVKNRSSGRKKILANIKVKDKNTIRHVDTRAQPSTSGQTRVPNRLVTKDLRVVITKLDAKKLPCAAKKKVVKTSLPVRQNENTVKSVNTNGAFDRDHYKEIQYLYYLQNTTYKGTKLSLLSEVENSKSLTDYSFRFESNLRSVVCKIKYLYVSNVSHSDINKMSLVFRTWSNSMFDIRKHFKIFLDNKKDNSHEPMKRLFVYSNLKLNVNAFRKNNVEIVKDDEDLIQFQVNPFVNDDVHEWFKKFLECCVMPNLAKEIIYSMEKKKVHLNTKVMKKYMNALINEHVIKIEKLKKNGKDIDIAKFHHNFINNCNLSRPALQLQRHMMKFLGGREKMPEMYFSIANLAEISSDVTNLPDEDSEVLFHEFFEIFRYGQIDNNFNEYNKFLPKQFAEAESVEYLTDIQRVTLESIMSNGSLENTEQSVENTISKCKLIKNSLGEPTEKNVIFEDETLEKIANQLGKGDRRIMHLCLTESASLTSLVIRQVSKSKFLYAENHEALFISGNVLLEMIDNVIDALILDSTKMLAIQWNDKDYDEIAQMAFAKIQAVLDGLLDDVKKSVVIVAKTGSNISQMGGVKIFDGENSFQLQQESQNEIVHLKNVKFQNHQISLLDLMDVEAAKTLMRMPQVPEALLFGELSFENELSEPFWLNKNYFDPQLKQHVIIDKKVFQENIEDIFCIKNLENKKIKELVPANDEIYDSRQFPLNAKYIMLDPHIDNYSLIFEHFQHRSVHIVDYVNYKFVWQTTRGSITNLLKHKIDDVDALRYSSPIQDILTAGPRTIIISGDSGMGKSTYLYNLARRMYTASRSEVDNPLWIIYVEFDKLYIKVPPKTTEDAVEVLATHLRFENAQKELFIMSVNGQLKLKVVLFVDGCEDLPSEDLKAPTKLLQKLQETCIQKIVVTSRSDSTLEAELGAFSYQLQFSNEQKIELLKNYWGVNSEVTEKAKNFIKKYESANLEVDFTCTPLQLKMLAEINKEEDELVPINNHHDLYKQYVDLHVQKDDIEIIEKLLMQKMMRDKVTIESNDNKDISDLPKNLHHISFAEYFIARSLSICCLPTNNPAYNLFIPLIDNTFIDGVSPVFLGTLLPLLKKNNGIETFINRLVQDGYLQFLKTILKFEKNAKPCLHDLIKSSNREKIRNFKNTTLGTLVFVLKHYNSTSDDEIMGHGEVKPEYIGSDIVNYVNSKKQNSTPLQVAATQNKVDLACELLLYGADILDVQDGHEEFILKISNYIVLKIIGGENRFYSISERLLMLIPAEEATKLCRQNYFKILSYFFMHGRIKIIKRLLSDPVDRSNFLNNCPAGQSPVDLINTSSDLSDEERRKMIEYISNNFGDDHIKNNIHQILRSACRSKHWHAFTYSVGNHQIDFLKSILRDNEHETLDFLKGRGRRYLCDKEGNTALHYAITLGVSPWTVNKTAEVCGIDDTNDDGMTALHMAFWKGTNLSLIRYLIEGKNASLIQKDKHGLYPWCYILIDEFCRYDKRQVLEIMEYLLTKSVEAPNYMEPNIVNDAYIKETRQKFKYYLNSKNMNSASIDEDVPPLHLALKDKVKENWCKFLIARIRDINARDSEGKTCLHLVLYDKRYQLVQLILQRGAIIDNTDKNGMTPLQILQSAPETTRDYENAKSLLELAEKMFTDRKTLRDNLSMSFSRFDKSPVRHLIGCRNKKGQSLYHVAASFGSASAIVYLAKLYERCRDTCETYEPRDINDQDDDGNTALHIAAEKGVKKVVGNLLCYGASFEITNGEGKLPADLAKSKSVFRAVEELFVAVKSGDVEKARKSLGKNRDYLVNARDEFGKCSLHYASDATMMKLLVRNFSEAYDCRLFIDTEVHDFDDRSPLYYAVEEGNLECAKLLIRAGDSIDLKDFKDQKNSTVELLRDVEMLFEDVNSDDPKYFTNENVWRLADFLKDKCSDVIVNARDDGKSTLLHYAAKYSFTKAVVILLKNGAVYDAVNLKKEVPRGSNKDVKNIFESVNKLFKNVDVAVWREIKLDPEIIVNCRKNGGYTLLHEAVKAGKTDEKEWLLEKGASVGDTDDFGDSVQSDYQILAT